MYAPSRPRHTATPITPTVDGVFTPDNAGKFKPGPILEDVPASGSIYYYRTPDEVHHVPKIRMEDILVRQAL